MQFQLPQFIETEDKIVGPFTLRQFLYIASAGALSFVLYFALANLFLFVILSAVFFAIAMSFAFLKVEGRPLPHVFISAFNFMWAPQIYAWQPEHPEIPKERELKGSGVSLEDIVSGVALRNAWKSLQTGTAERSPEKTAETGRRYQIFQRLSGERRAARRVDYR